jgi:mannonate dehydratase
MAAMADAFQVRTAWHGPGDVSPIGHCANVTLDVVCPNFGIQEWTNPNDRIQEVFDGYPVMKDGYAYPNDKPGWGVEINMAAAAKYPFGFSERGERKTLNGGWGVVRRPDGTVINQ